MKRITFRRMHCSYDLGACEQQLFDSDKEYMVVCFTALK